MGDKINLALIGAGHWGKNLARVFFELGILKIICDSSEDVLKRKSAKYPEIATTSSFANTLASTDINAIAIATPAEQHYSLAKKSLLAGKHVFVEKPLSMTAIEGEEIVQIAKQKGKVLFVGHVLQYHPAIQTIKKILQDGQLGKLQYIYSNRLNLGKIRREENILWSFAPHDISLILSLVGEEPIEVTATGTNILHPEIADTTTTNIKFPSGVGAHIFVSWLHPFKEQKLVLIGDQGMIVFDDTVPTDQKLMMYPHQISWKNGIPIPDKKQGNPVDLTKQWKEPLMEEGRAFINSIHGKPAFTDGEEGLRVLKVLQRAQASMDNKNDSAKKTPYFIHPTSDVDDECEIGKNTKVWHYSHILTGSKIGEGANIGQNVMIGPNGVVGNNVKIQNNVSIYEGVTLEDDVFCGPSCVFTNVINPRSKIPRKNELKATIVRQGATIGANSTILCGVTIGKFAFVGAGAVVTKDIPDYGLAYGNPAKLHGWMCECGNRLDNDKKCQSCGKTMPIP
ncbi:MAG: Gfo/Idh/MocA family oxidoreductase [Nitrospina sp.]|nr:Gfo/Idh/MocA family oxidoreductase [Nitrospina sp.]MBT3875004.1 Gfo/Idh/MocA family oxidoreductase [Nitrospina sp.]MBT4049655.1 Gfo/Idh/MocA family oxidoreductase [Nitrospina sp.]MBT5348169.1 Gfo/Idh/MocA family oxidoreductase [Nitrospina sp.]MBT5652089.1 Gfo/Idh/MocA family oxidoreductase [Nitrospina sp.]